MKVVILCGGLGTRLREETEYRPKPMVPIGGRPILWHIMNRYAAYGFTEFVLCLGYKGHMVKEYYLHHRTQIGDFTLRLSRGGHEAIEYHDPYRERAWVVTFADTGERAMTGARVKRVERFIEGQTFMLTYGDGLADIDLSALLEAHRRHGRIGTLTSVHPGPSRFGELVLKGDRVTEFVEKPDCRDGWVNGGFFIFQREFLRYLDDDDACVLEREPLQRLAHEGQLMAYRHQGYWQCLDTFRDQQQLTEAWSRGQAPWTVTPRAAGQRRRAASRAVAGAAR